MRKQIVLIATFLCVALLGYAQMVVKGKAGGVLYEVNLAQQKATVLGAVDSPTELTIPATMPQFEVTEFAINPGAVGSMMNVAAPITTIADGAFATCSSLTSVTMEAVTPPTLNGTFASTFPAGVIIYVPSNSAVTEYQEAGWQNVQADVTPISGPTGNCGAEGDNLTWTYADGTLYITGTGAMTDFTIDYTVLPYAAITPWKQYLYSITNIELSEGITYIGQGAFFGMDKVKKVVFPEGLIEIGDNAFGNCQGIKSFTFPSTLQTVGNGMFSNNYAIKEIETNATVPADMKQNRLNNGATFKISVYVPEGYISTYEDAWGTDYYEFYEPKDMCGANLRWKYNASTHALTLYRFDETKPATMYNFQNISDHPEFFNTPDAPWYQYHDEIASISLPEGLTNIGTMAFVNCSTVVSEVVIPSTVIYIETLSFGYCHSIPHIEIPDGVQSIDAKAFVGCSSLNSIHIPAGISTIKESAFEYCSSLPYLYLPATVQTIERNAFNNCTNLVRIDVESEIPATIASDDNLGGVYGAISNGQRVFGREFSDGGEVDIEVYIPSGTKAAYEAAWGIETAVDVFGMHQVQCRLNYHDPADQGGTTDVESALQSAVSVQKVLKNGQIFIQKGEDTYSLDGKKL